MSQYVTRKTVGDSAWFTHDRFGMFIHWGIMSMADSVHGCWNKSVEMTPEDKYQKYFDFFDPDLYDPKEWAALAKKAGMKYVVLTTKHHDGFCLFDSKYTEYKCTNTKAGRDLVKEFVNAFRAEGIRIGFYYSLLDWIHPHFTIDICHPRREDDNAQELNAGRNMDIYRQYMKDQVTELLTNYGKIDIMWYDFTYDNNNNLQFSEQLKGWGGKGQQDWDAQGLVELTRKLQPGILINNRMGIEQDFRTPEQYQMTDWVKDPVTGELVVWEACQTLAGEWVYSPIHTSQKSPEMLIQMLINTVSCGGNLLMNVGPTPRGYIDEKAVSALTTYADWMKYNGRSIYGCTKADEEFTAPKGCVLTQSEDGKRLYVHLFEYPFQFLEMRDMAGKVDYAQFLHDGNEIRYTEGKSAHFSKDRTEADDLLVLKLPALKPNVTVPVIELFLKTE